MTMLLIAGFHRSGTSMVARMFHKGGLFLGNDLLPAHESNPYGHFEDPRVIAFHDSVLKENGTTWQFDGDHSNLVMSEELRGGLSTLIGERNHRKNWGLKDPRVCLFLKNWVGANPECFIIAIFRDFISTTQSLLKRHASDLLMARGPALVHLRFWQDHELAYRMWLAYNKALLEAVELFPGRSLSVYHSQVLTGMDVPAIINARINAGILPVAVSELVDLEVTQTSITRLPLIGAELRAKLIQTWKDIERVCGPSGLVIGDLAERAFETRRSEMVQFSTQNIAEFDDAATQYRAALSQYKKLRSNLNQ